MKKIIVVFSIITAIIGLSLYAQPFTSGKTLSKSEVKKKMGC